MKSAFAYSAAAVAFATAAAFSPSPSFADKIKPRVVPPSVTVPDDGGYGFAGSWKVQGLLYNRFQLAVHFDRYGGGSYRAKVGHYESCNGSLSWHQTYGNKMMVQLSSSWCDGPSGKWSADKMVCQTSGYSGVSPKVVPPGPVYGQKLSCTYLPSAYYLPAFVSLKRS